LTTPTYPHLVWKFEQQGVTNELDDLGPAWIVESPDRRTDVEEGHWVTRGQARALASARALPFFEDDGAVAGRGEHDPEPIEVRSINHLLRRAGVAPEELNVEPFDSTQVVVLGTLLSEWAERERHSRFRVGARSMPLADAVVLLDSIVPGWRHH